MRGLDLSAIIVNAIGVGSGVMAIAMLVLRLGNTRSRHLLALLAMLTILTIDCIFSIYELSPIAARFPAPVGGGYLFLAWFPTALWLYVDDLTTMGPRDRPSLRWHILTSCLTMVCLAPMFMLPGTDKRAFIEDRFVLVMPSQTVLLLGLVAFLAIWISHLIVTGIAVARRLLRHRRRVRELCSDVETLDLRWLDGFLLLIGGGIAIGAIDNLLPLITSGEFLDVAGSALFEATIILGLALFGLHQGRATPDWAEDVDEPAPPAGPIHEKRDGRYARSSLSEADCAEIAGKLDRVMQTDKPWRDPFLNLKTLAEHISTRPYYVTQAINTTLGRNFYDYVNGWRIQAACAALTTGSESVLSICETVGFNSKSTFNTVFRKETGVTPSAYRRLKATDPA